MLATLMSLKEHLYPRGVIYILSIHILIVLLVIVTVGYTGVLRWVVGICPLPSAAGKREVVLVLVVHTIIVIVAGIFYPQVAARLVVVHALMADAQIDHRLVVGIQVKLEHLAVLQPVVECDFKLYLIGFIQQILFCHTGTGSFIVHHPAKRRIGRTHYQVVDRHQAVLYTLIHSIRRKIGLVIIAFSVSGGPLRTRRVDVVFFTRIVVSYEIILHSIIHVLVFRVVVAAALSNEVRYHFALFSPFGLVGLVSITVIPDIVQQFHIAELNLRGGGILLRGGYPIGIFLISLDFHSRFAGIAMHHSRVYQDVGQHTGQTMAEGQLDALHRRINGVVGGHTQIVRQQRIVAHRCFIV